MCVTSKAVYLSAPKQVASRNIMLSALRSWQQEEASSFQLVLLASSSSRETCAG